MRRDEYSRRSLPSAEVFAGWDDRRAVSYTHLDVYKRQAKRNSIETARVLLAMGKLSYEEIAQSVRLLTVDEVKALDEGRPA